MAGQLQLGGLKLPADKRTLVIAGAAAALVLVGPRLLKAKSPNAAAGAGVTVDQLLAAMAQTGQTTADVARAAFGPAASLGMAGLQVGGQLGLGGEQLAASVVDTLGRSTDVLSSSLANVASRAVDALASPRSPLIYAEPITRPLPDRPLIPPPSVAPASTPAQTIAPTYLAPPILRPNAPSAAAYYATDKDLAAAVKAQAPVQLAGTQIKLVTGEWVTL